MDVVVGYGPYLDLIAPVIAGKERLATPMTKEVDRANEAMDLALSGRSCALVSGGDPGIYALAGLVLELCAHRGIVMDSDKEGALAVEVVPGIPALSAGAAVLGAPLTHDFAAISLSDLLTPWETIERRLDAAASADFVMVIYNPKSKKRNWQLDKAREIILKHRPDNTPVGIVTAAMRESQQVHLCTLKDLPQAEVGMQSIVFVGNASTFMHDGRMVTPRGYSEKYEL